MEGVWFNARIFEYKDFRDTMESNSFLFIFLGPLYHNL